MTTFKQLVAETTAKTNEKEQKKSYVCYVYGQIYSSFLQSGKAKVFLIENVHVREWKNILEYLKREKHISDYAMGETVEDAGKLVVKNFNTKNLIYKKYLKGIEKNLQAA